MTIVQQLAVFFLVTLVGESIAGVLPFAMPGSVLAMVVMFILLSVRVLRLDQVGDVADFLVGNMAILFIPLAVGVVEVYPLVRGKAAEVVLLCVATTFLTFFAALAAAGLAVRIGKKRRRGDGEEGGGDVG